MKRIFLTAISALALVSISSAYAAIETRTLSVGNTTSYSIHGDKFGDPIVNSNSHPTLIKIAKTKSGDVVTFTVTALKSGTTMLIFSTDMGYTTYHHKIIIKPK